MSAASPAPSPFAPPHDLPFQMPEALPDGPSFEQLARRAREGVALLRTRLSIPTPTGPNTTIERVFWLDPYAVEIVLQDARHGRDGTRLEVHADPNTPASVVARVRGRLAKLQRRGISVDVRRAARRSP